MRRARRIDRVLAETYPDATCELDFDNPFELLVVTVLSAQTTDKRVNAVRPTLFAAYPDAPAMAAADRARTSSRSSARSASSAPRPSRCSSSARRSSSVTTARCPPRLDDLVTLPGVGRKTANVVLGNAFGIPGITVDTHFGRLARRFGWTEETDPVKVEHAVGALFPKRDWTMLSHHLIWHGRRCCHAQKPACGACPVAQAVPVVRRRADRPGDRRQAGEDRGAGVTRLLLATVAWALLLAGCSGEAEAPLLVPDDHRPPPSRSRSTPPSCATSRRRPASPTAHRVPAAVGCRP